MSDVPPAEVQPGTRIRPEALAQSRKYDPRRPTTLPIGDTSVFKAAGPTPGTLPDRKNVDHGLAMDEDMSGLAMGAYGGASFLTENLTWLGFPYLAELAQRSEYRLVVGTIAREMTRRWIKIVATGGQDKTDKVRALERLVKKYRLQARARQAIEKEGFFGRAHWYFDMGIALDDAELLRTALIPDKRLVERGAFRGVRVVEPMWAYPGRYNSTDPLARDFYLPTTWYVMKREVHQTRLQTFVSNPVPDYLKPAYQFGGVSMTQMMKPYVDNWLRTRQSISDLVHSFSTMVLKTDMSAVLEGGGLEQEDLRAQLFNNFRDNRNLMMLNKETEDLVNVQTSLGGLDKLQAQSQEQMACPAQMPLVVFTGITPTGLNATSEGELQVWAQRVNGMQENMLRDPLELALDLIQLSEFGEIDPDISFVFEPLEEESAKDRAERHNIRATMDGGYVEKGILSPEEVRHALSNEDDTPYAGVDLSGPAPEPPPPPGMPGEAGAEDGAPDKFTELAQAIRERRG